MKIDTDVKKTTSFVLQCTSGKKHLSFRYILLLLVFFIYAGLPSGGFALTIKGKCFDTYYKPLSGMVIELIAVYSDSLRIKRTSDSAGIFIFDTIPEKEYRIKIASRDSFPEQWYAPGLNTRYSQHKMWFGPAIAADTLRIRIVSNPVNNPPTCTLSVSVVDTSGKPLPKTSIEVIRESDMSHVMQIYNDSSPITGFNALQPDGYALSISSPPYPRQYYDTAGNGSSPKYFVKLALNEKKSVTVKLVIRPSGNGFISGFIYNEASLPLQGLTISLYSQNDTLAPAYSQITSLAGQFLFSSLYEGNYYLKISGGTYPDQWYSRMLNKTLSYHDDPIWTTPTNADTMRIYLSANPFDNRPKSVVKVRVYTPEGSVAKEFGKIGLIEMPYYRHSTILIDSLQKLYISSPVKGGEYAVAFDIPGYARQFFNPNGNTANDSYHFQLGTSDTILLEVNLKRIFTDTTTTDYAYITSIVRDSLGPVSGATVNVYERNGSLLSTATTDSAGKTKTLKVSAREMYLCAAALGYPRQFWTHANGRPTISLSTRNYFSIPTMSTMVAEFHLVTNPDRDSTIFTDTTKKYNGLISGQVKNSTEPLSGVKVLLLENNYQQFSYSPQHLQSQYYTYTDSAGKFIFNNLSFGKFLVAAVTDTQNYIAQFYKNADIPANATQLTIDTNAITGIVFQLRIGGIVKGIVKEAAGNAIAGAKVTLHENIHNGRFYDATSASDGSWVITAVPKGTWNISVHHEFFLQSTNTGNAITVTEGTTTTVPSFTMEMGGRFSGTVTVNTQGSTTSVPNTSGRVLLFPADKKSAENYLWPKYIADIQIGPDSFQINKVRFISGLCPTGIYKAIFVPIPTYWSSDTTQKNSAAYGYSFFNGDTSFDGPSIISIQKGSMADANTLHLRKGKSVFCTLSDGGVNLTSQNQNITIFVKSGNQYFQVLSGYRQNNGQFEIPGLTNKESYYIKAWSDGYPDQFWSQTGTNSTYPKTAFTFDSTQTNYMINLVKKPEGSNVNFNQMISVWPASDTTTGKPVLKWIISPSLSIDTMYVYSRNKTSGTLRVATINFFSGKNAYEWTDTRILSGRTEYCVVGKGNGSIVRSDIISVDARKQSVPWGQLWIDIAGNRHGISIEWGINDTVTFTPKDTVVLYNRLQGGIFGEIDRRTAMEPFLYDHKWSRSDSLKTYEYRVELLSQGKKSSIVPYTLGATFFTGLGKEFRVGPTEKYLSIQQAIDAAGNFDFVNVRSGTYRERLDFRGKNINLYGDWENNRPVILDASGGTAITIPLTKYENHNDGGIYIGGFKITNAAIGIQSHGQVQVNRCLFSGTQKGIVITPDSQAIAVALQADPFRQKSIYASINNCTFIATSRLSLSLSLVSFGSSDGSAISTMKEHDQQMILPLKSVSSFFGIYNTLFAYYGTTGSATTFPVTISGSFSSGVVDRCATWQTPSNPVSDAITFSSTTISYDPQFNDTTFFFTGDSSMLTKMAIGYNSGNNKGGDSHKELSPVTNLVTFNRAIDKIELRWNPVPPAEKAVSYKIYRIPGDPKLFFAKDSLWDIIISEDSFMTIVDTFTTRTTSFVDGSIIPGKPYLYVVVAVDTSGNESSVRLSSSKPINSYFCNSFNFTFAVKAGQWSMVSPWGVAPTTIDSSGKFFIYQWNSNRPKDKLLSYYSSVRTMVPGTGYWFKSLIDTTLTVSTSAPAYLLPTQDTLKCRLSKGVDGWNQVASPLPHRVNPKLPPGYAIWEWLPDSIGYRRTAMMEPWKGYWIYTLKDTSFVYNSGENYTSSSKTLAKRSSLAAWELTVSLKGSGGNDPENILGVFTGKPTTTSSSDIPEPPQPFGGNHIYFIKKQLQDNETEQSSNLSYQYLQVNPQTGEQLEWQVGICTPNGQSVVTVSGIESCPKSTGLFWISKGTVTDLRQSNSVTVAASSQETFGYIVATSNPMDLALYTATFALRSPYPNPSVGNVMIDYVLPYQWESSGLKNGDNGLPVSIILYDISGRTVSTLFDGKQLPGKHRAVWNGQSQSGSPVSSGMYILRFRSGEFVKNVQMFRVR